MPIRRPSDDARSTGSMDSQSPSAGPTLEPSTRPLFSTWHSLFVETVAKKSDPRTIFWLGLSIALSVTMAYGPLRQAFSGAYVLQDDSRQHIFWMERFVDPDLFPHDFIVDYLQTVAPLGYKAFYRVGAVLGIDPLSLGKLLPIGLGLLTTLLCFVVSMQLLPVPSSAFIATTLLGQALWSGDSIVSSTPRAFMYPLLLLFLSSFISRSSVLCLASIAMLCLFYPPIVPIPLGVIVLSLVRWDSKRFCLSRERRDYILCAAALAIAAAILLPYAHQIAAFGPVVSADEGRTMPEFLAGGRMVVFREGFVDYWLTGKHSGMFAPPPFQPLGLALALPLPLLWVFRERFHLANRISPGIAVFPRVILASLIMFFAAHALLFKLYLPSRFTAHSFRIVLALGAGISATIVLDALFDLARRIASPRRRFGALVVGSGAVLIWAIALYPLLSGSFSREKYKTGEYPELYEFLSHQPKTAVIASLSREVDDLPVFAKRSILIGREIALPYHKKYYAEIRQRAIDLINAEYSSDLTELQRFIRAYDVGFLLLDKRAFLPGHLAADKWLMQFQPATEAAIARLRNGDIPVLKAHINQYTVLENDDLVLLDANRILSSSP